MFQITCDVQHVAELEELHDFQNEMKTLSTENYLKLRREIEEVGFSFAVHVWESVGKLYILDGHQRVACVRRMLSETPLERVLIPIVKVSAKDYAEAKRKVLGAASQYGEFQSDGLLKTLNEANLDIPDAFEHFNLPTVNFSDLIPLKFEEKTVEPSEKKDDQQKRFIIEVQFPNDMEMNDIKDDLLSRGYIVRVK